MYEGRPPLERVAGRGVGWSLRHIALLVVVAAIAFVIGFGVGAGSPAAPGATPAASPAPPATTAQPVVGFDVSPELQAAFHIRGTDGWGLCLVGAQITCQPINVTPGQALSQTFPQQVTDQDWTALSPSTVAPGRYVLAAPMSEVGGWAVLVGTNDAGYPRYQSIPPQAVNEGVLWVDLAAMGRGRYVVAVTAYLLSVSDSQGRSYAQRVTWGVGLSVAGSP